MSLRLVGVAKHYPGWDLELSWEVPAGTLAAILGPSGCGKTTTLRIVAGLLAPDRGTVWIAGGEVTRVPPEDRNVGIVFQDYALFPHMNVEQNIAFGPRMRGWSGREIAARVAELLELVGLEGYARRRVEELSGGEQQRVALARALAPRPQVLLLDEPLSALDRGLRENLRREIRRIQKELRVTTVYVTHDQEEALALADRVLVMQAGRAAQEGTPQELYCRPSTRFVASFVGRSNQLEGRVTTRQGDTVSVETPCGLLRSLSANDIAPGARVVVLFRPESCRVVRSTSTAASGGAAPHQGPASGADRPAPATPNRIAAAVESVEFAGEAYLIRARTAAGPLLAKTAAATDGRSAGPPPEPGQRVELTVAPEACWALPA